MTDYKLKDYYKRQIIVRNFGGKKIKEIIVAIKNSM